MRAFNPAGWTPFDYARYTIPLLPPADFAASDGLFADKIVLTWSAAEGAEGYLIYRDDNTGAPYAEVGDVESYDDTAVTPGQVYRYWIRAQTSTCPMAAR